MTIQHNITESAQQWTHVLVDGIRCEREPWNPVAIGLQHGSARMNEGTKCGDCGVSSGQLHWMLCDQDFVGGVQLLGVVTEADYCAGDDSRS
jgi:hypothetical protein